MNVSDRIGCYIEISFVFQTAGKQAPQKSKPTLSSYFVLDEVQPVDLIVNDAIGDCRPPIASLTIRFTQPEFTPFRSYFWLKYIIFVMQKGHSKILSIDFV
jgi:hypothetical protein